MGYGYLDKVTFFLHEELRSIILAANYNTLQCNRILHICAQIKTQEFLKYLFNVREAEILKVITMIIYMADYVLLQEN